MGVLDVLSGAATVVGRGVEGLGADKQIRLADALARRKAEDEAERSRVLNLLTQRQIAEPRLGEPEYATARGEVAGAESMARIPADVARETELAPIRAENRNIDPNSPEGIAAAVERERQIAPIRAANREPERITLSDQNAFADQYVQATGGDPVRAREWVARNQAEAARLGMTRDHYQAALTRSRQKSGSTGAPPSFNAGGATPATPASAPTAPPASVQSSQPQGGRAATDEEIQAALEQFNGDVKRATEYLAQQGLN